MPNSKNLHTADKEFVETVLEQLSELALSRNDHISDM